MRELIIQKILEQSLMGLDEIMIPDLDYEWFNELFCDSCNVDLLEKELQKLPNEKLLQVYEGQLCQKYR